MTSTRHAFTLVELMIALALGMVIVFTALAGFRVASQSVTLVNRLALENAVMRAGCQSAHDRLDFWTDYDDPEDPGNQRLRLAAIPHGGAPGDGFSEGGPFTPMSEVFPLVRSADPERTTGWDGADPLPAGDPRTWWHGSMAEKDQSNLVLGRYGIFANCSTTPTITASFGPYRVSGGPITVLHSWQYNHLWGLHAALGYYGFADYMPANTLYACYQSVRSGQTNDDGMPYLLCRHTGSQFDNAEGAQEFCKGLWRLSMATSYGLVTPLTCCAAMASAHQRNYATGYWNNATGVTDLLRDTNNRQALFSGPDSWPKAQVTIARFIKTCRFVSLCRVRWTSPVTGESAELAFTCFGTTLRGARLQRRHPSQGGGWADWDDAPGSANHLTLDDTP
jgi:hypothetical protein